MEPADLEVVETESEFVQRALEHVRVAHDRALEERGRFVMALTGGSTPRPIHRAMAEVDWLRWPATHVFVGDERAVPADHPASNCGAARRDFLDVVGERRGLPRHHVHLLDGGAEDLDAEVAAYDRALEETCGGAVDLLFLGLGSDAHVLSLYPGSAPLGGAPGVDAPWFVVLRDPPMDPPLTRLSGTPSWVQRSRRVVVLAASEKKSEALRSALEDDDDPSRVPAHIVRRAPSVVWLADRPATRRLHPR